MNQTLKRPAGRPRETTLSRAQIIEAGLALMADSSKVLSMRGLAQALGVSPMALYHHVASRDALLEAMADHVLAPVAAPGEGSAGARAAVLLEAYCRAVIEHARLFMALFAAAEPLTPESRRITAELDALMGDTADARRRRDVLIDYTHGYALALGARGGALDPAAALAEYRATLPLLLKALLSA